jgi:hypothetical protein
MVAHGSITTLPFETFLLIGSWPPLLRGVAADILALVIKGETRNSWVLQTFHLGDDSRTRPVQASPANMSRDEVVDQMKVGQDETPSHHEDPLDGLEDGSAGIAPFNSLLVTIRLVGVRLHTHVRNYLSGLPGWRRDLDGGQESTA